MIAEHLIWYFLPPKLRDKLHPDYDQVCIIISGLFIAGLMLFVLPIPLLFISGVSICFTLLGVICLVNCFAIKAGADFRVSTSITFVACFIIIPYIIIQSGGIRSPFASALYGVMLTGWWAGRKFGIFTSLGGIACFCVLPFLTNLSAGTESIHDKEVLAALILHVCLTIFFSVFFYMSKEQNEHARLQVRKQQHLRINELDTAVKERTKQLNTVRHNLATDFHDETGNMLSAITRQAGMLKLSLPKDHQSISVVESIILNSERLYASSRDFLWGIEHESDDPTALFTYLTSFGQFFYNQFDIAFSVKQKKITDKQIGLLPILVARHLIFIFKEAMTNVVKHADAKEVVLTMELRQNELCICLIDDGIWKNIVGKNTSNGIKNMQKRSVENGFKLEIAPTEKGTTIMVNCPLNFYDI